MTLNFEDSLACAKYLDSLENFKVLNKVSPQKVLFNPNVNHEPTRLAIYLDCESTGLSFDDDKVIEFGMLVFSYGVNSGSVFEIKDQYSGFEDPGHPLSEEIKKITGILDEDLQNQKFDDTTIEQKCQDATLVIAHNAAFDRNMLEKRFEFFKEMPWACSQKDIPWMNYQLSQKLEYLLFKFGYFYQGHRALIDCFAGLTLLSENLSKINENENENVLKILLQNARSTSYIIRAIRAPFDKKDDLKKRGYIWHAGDIVLPEKFWWTEVKEDFYQDEINWLSSEIYQSDFPLNLHNIHGATTKITAKQRHKRFY